MLRHLHSLHGGEGHHWASGLRVPRHCTPVPHLDDVLVQFDNGVGDRVDAQLMRLWVKAGRAASPSEQRLALRIQGWVVSNL